MRTLAFAVVLLSSVAAFAEPPWIGLQLAGGSFGGARVKSVVPGSPGERAGLHAGDEVLAIDERATATPEDVIQTVQHGGVGHAAKLRVVDAKGHTRTVAVTYEARPDRETMQRHALVG